LGFSQATHLLAIGGMGGMILAMISRVSLGHTGRPLQPAAAMSLAFILINLAVPLRVWLTIPMPLTGYWLAALCWASAFALFVWHYTPILLAPRPDGRPGCVSCSGDWTAPPTPGACTGESRAGPSSRISS